MFSNITYEVPAQTGKKIYGLPSRKDPSFSIGWDSHNQLNDFQLRKAKNKEVTGKITTQAIIQSQDIPQRNVYEPQMNDYERRLYENGNMTRQELEKMMERYEQQRGTPSRSSQSGLVGGEGQRRVPIRPRESMKEVLYNGVGVGEEVANRVGPRVLADLQSVIIIPKDLRAIIIIMETTEIHQPSLSYHSLIQHQLSFFFLGKGKAVFSTIPVTFFCAVIFFKSSLCY